MCTKPMLRRGMLLYNGIVRGERFIATISMSPFHGYRFVRGQRCASSPLRGDASFAGRRERDRERERAAMAHRVSMRSPRSDSFLRFSSQRRFLASSRVPPLVFAFARKIFRFSTNGFKIPKKKKKEKEKRKRKRTVQSIFYHLPCHRGPL